MYRGASSKKGCKMFGSTCLIRANIRYKLLFAIVVLARTYSCEKLFHAVPESASLLLSRYGELRIANDLIFYALFF